MNTVGVRVGNVLLGQDKIQYRPDLDYDIYTVQAAEYSNQILYSEN